MYNNSSFTGIADQMIRIQDCYRGLIDQMQYFPDEGKEVGDLSLYYEKKEKCRI